jgi:hypothetical protein
VRGRSHPFPLIRLQPIIVLFYLLNPNFCLFAPSKNRALRWLADTTKKAPLVQRAAGSSVNTEKIQKTFLSLPERPADKL